MSERFLQQLSLLPENLANHLMITVIPLALSLAISLPLAILLVRRPSLRYPVTTAVSVIQTIPSLALLALMVPILAGVGLVTSWAFGVEVSALGFYPTVIALTLYGILPILRNGVTGILGVDPRMTEAARGMGMTPRQVLGKVELPLAAPVIIAGIRTATVWIVGTATLATPVGQRSLGNYIFTGLQTRNWISVLFGCVAAAALAIVLDSLIGALERAVAERRRRLALGSLVALAAIFGGGLVAPRISRALQRPDSVVVVDGPGAAEAGADGALRRPIRIGSKVFTEQYILAELIARRLTEAGYPVRKVESLGSVVGFSALTKNEIDVFVDYSGTIWANYMHREQAAEDWKVLAEVNGWLAAEHGVRALGTLGFENAYSLAMRREQAERLGITTIGDLAEHAPMLTIGGDYEFFGRPEWQAIRSIYGLRFTEKVVYDPTFLYESLANGTVDVISAYTTDGRIEAYDLVILDDPREAIPPYDALLLLAPGVADRPGVVRSLEPLVNSITAEAMRAANSLVDRSEDKQTIDAAAEYLESRIDKTASDP